jgi:hypothetical protein
MEKVYNTVSKRYLTNGGQQYKKLIAEGYILQNKELIPPVNKKLSVKSTKVKSIKNVKSVKSTNSNLPNDILYEIMLKSDIGTVHQYCLTNKSALQLCQNSQFWKQKFNDDQLPLLYEFPQNNFNLLDEEHQNTMLEEKYIKKEPTTWTQWEKLYRQTQFLINQALRFVNQIIKTGHFMEFYTPELRFPDYLWLPTKWFQYVHQLDEKNIPHVPEIFYTISKKKKDIRSS